MIISLQKFKISRLNRRFFNNMLLAFVVIFLGLIEYEVCVTPYMLGMSSLTKGEPSSTDPFLNTQDCIRKITTPVKKKNNNIMIVPVLKIQFCLIRPQFLEFFFSGDI